MHERVGVCMGYEFIPPNERNPEGYYEDKEMVEFNKNWYEKPVERWKKIRARRNTVFGVKDPRIADHIEFYKNLEEPKRFIWCIRNEEDTLKSLRKTFSHLEALDIYERRMRNMLGVDSLKIYVGIDTEDDIIKKLYDCSNFA